MNLSIIPNFNHRFSEIHENHSDFTDSIHLMANRALGVLHLIALQFEHDCASKMSDEIIANAIDSVICEIGDIQAYTRAFNAKNPR